jgi:hypothetical protein
MDQSKNVKNLINFNGSIDFSYKPKGRKESNSPSDYTVNLIEIFKKYQNVTDAMSM